MSDQIGHYRIRQKLGSGGMGDVYLAEDLRLRRTVALKVLPAAVARDPSRRNRFLQEAHAASVLSHPNVSTIHEVGEDGESVFIAMEFIDGKTLSQVREQRTPSVAEVVDIALQVADALDEAQTRGIVHRDIKSANIMLTARGHVKVLDFGLAKMLLTPSDDEDTRIKTGAGLVVGTPYFMSPEQALGRAVDHRSDLFSLGVVLYELVTGRLPFTAKTTTETIEKITHADPEPMARFNYGLPLELERIIRKLLEKDPDRRYQSARDLIVDLKNLKRDSASGETPRVIAPAAPSRKRPAIATGVALAVLALAGVAYFALKNGTTAPGVAPRIDSVAVLPFANASSDAESDYLSDGISETIINDLSRIDGLRVVPRSTVFQFKGKQDDIQSAAETLNVNAVVTGRVLQRGESLTVSAELIDARTNAQLWGARYERSISEALALQQEISREISARLRPAGTESAPLRTAGEMTRDPEAYQLYLKGRYHWNRRTGESLQKALGFFEEAVATDPGFALAHIGVADSYLLMEQYADRPSAETTAKAEAAIRKALEIDEMIPEAHASLGFIHMNRRHWNEADASFRRAIELNPDYPTARHWYNIHLRQTGRLDEAYAQIRRAQELDPLSMIIGVNMVEILAMLGRDEEAIRMGERYLEINPDFPQMLGSMSSLYSEAGRHKDAIASAEKAARLSNQVTEQVANLGTAYAAAGKEEEARAILRRLEERVATSGADPYHLATLYAALGDHERAFAALEKSIAMNSGMVGGVKVERGLRPLRSDARFEKILRRMGLPV
ncbi:MAG TPA: protein kinase [Thermoanaerobaculia bacterium]|nr:protein kinase [Thermoanaerobaculia bacterium]